MYCKKCGNEISDGAKFCKFCGAVQETQAAGSFQKPQNVDPVKEAEQQRQRERLDQQKKCPNCGGMVAGARFCPKCGYDLNSIKEK